MRFNDSRVERHERKAFEAFDSRGRNLGLTRFKNFSIHFDGHTVQCLALALMNRRGPC